VASITESLRLDDIVKSTGSQIRAVHFNEKGDLVAAAENK
jgi:ATP-dependent RNA helicase DeaD